MNKRIECTVSGRVQMVMFRDFTKRNARALNLTGYVQNEKDGTVHVVAQGDEEKLEKLLELLHRGSVLAKVENVSVQYSEPDSEFTGFNIRY